MFQALRDPSTRYVVVKSARLSECWLCLLSLQVIIGTDPLTVFKDADWALLIGAKPRGPGMERSALLDINGQVGSRGIP